MNQLLVPAGVRPARVSELRITDGILDLVKARLGISVVAGWAAADDVAAGRLVSIPIEGGLFVRQWQAAATEDTLELPHVRRFVELLVENQAAFCGAA
jgi:DNA-binding transcriptional LysR family regulator